MKAAVRSKYGPGDVLSIKEIDLPTPKEDEILVKVYTATVSRTDCHILTGRPLFMHLFTGFFKPRLKTTGTDFAGQIVSVGKNVNIFKTGDRVMGFNFMGLRSHAQYLVLPADKEILKISDSITYEQASACAEGPFYAMNGIVKVKPGPGHKALVYGASGAIGSAYVQLLKYHGTYVTAVCGTENMELIRSLGADKVIDYKTEDFTKDNERYDFVLDAVGKSTFGKCKKLLKKKGMYASSGGIQNLFLAILTPLFGGKKVLFATPKNYKDCLHFILDLVEKGKFRPVIDRKYPLEKISEAFNYVGTGQKTGNVILMMDNHDGM